MYPNDYDPYQLLQLAAMTPAGNPLTLPTMTPATSYFGPMHKALKDAFTASLARPNNDGLLASVTPEEMGLLSPPTPMLANSFFRMPSDFASPPVSPAVQKAQEIAKIMQMQREMGNSGHERPDQPVYANDFTRSDGPVYNTNGYSGPYNNGGGSGATFNDGSLLGGLTSAIAGMFTPKVQPYSGSDPVVATPTTSTMTSPAQSAPTSTVAAPLAQAAGTYTSPYDRLSQPAGTYTAPYNLAQPAGTYTAPYNLAQPAGTPFSTDSFWDRLASVKSQLNSIRSMGLAQPAGTYTTPYDVPAPDYSSYSLPADLQEARSQAAASNALATTNQAIRNAFGDDRSNATVNGMMSIIGPRGVDPIAEKMAYRLPDSFSQPLITGYGAPLATTQFGDSSVIPSGAFVGGGGNLRDAYDSAMNSGGLLHDMASLTGDRGFYSDGGAGAGGWGSDSGGGRGG